MAVIGISHQGKCQASGSHKETKQLCSKGIQTAKAMRPADGKCSYVFKGKNSPEVRGNPSSHTIARKGEEGNQLLGATKHGAAVDEASAELGCISTRGEW